MPYGVYDKVDFKEIVYTEGDCFARYLVRMDEIMESLNIIEQLIDNIPEGPYQEKMKPIIDLTKKMQGASKEEQMKVLADIKRKKEELEKELKEIAPEQLVFEKYIYTLDGKGYGPYAKDAMICFSRSGGEHWAAMFNGTLRIDGVEMQVPGGIYPTSDILWISPDGQRFALKEYDKSAFSDGKEYPYPMHVTYENGELIWLCMENKESIVRYSLDF